VSGARGWRLWADGLWGVDETFCQGQSRGARRIGRPGAGAGCVQAKHRLTIPLASNETHKMLEAYGVWGKKSMYGKTFMGIVRTTFLIAADGKIARVWSNVKVDGHADEVLAAAQAL